jgi:hypothetical protein
MPKNRNSIRDLCQIIGVTSFLALSAGCLPPPVVITFQSTPTPVLLSRVDRIGGTPQATTPKPIATFKGNVRSELVTESTTVTDTTTTTGEKKGYSTGKPDEKNSGYSTGEKPPEKKEGYSTGANNNTPPKGYSTGQAPKYAAPPRTPTSEAPKVQQNQYVYGAGAAFQQGPNLLTYYSLRALYSEGARQKNPTPPNPKDVDIYIDSLRVRAIFLLYTDSDTSQSDPETTSSGQTSTTTTSEETTTVYRINGARVKASITPKR